MAAPMAEWLVAMLFSSQVVDWVDRMVVTLVGRSVARSVALMVAMWVALKVEK